MSQYRPGSCLTAAIASGALTWSLASACGGSRTAVASSATATNAGTTATHITGLTSLANQTRKITASSGPTNAPIESRACRSP